MRKNQINEIVNDILHAGEDFNPIDRIFLKNKLYIDLLTGKILYTKEDDVSKFYRDKYLWFQNRIKKLGGNLKDFKQANILVHGNIEKIKIIYKDTSFEKQQKYGEMDLMIKRIKDEIKKLKPSADRSKGLK